MQTIRFIKRHEIDTTKWNDCIINSKNGKIYGLTWYLDQMAVFWDALIEGDYESVFPLPWNKRLVLVKQIYQPVFSQQLGLFSKKAISPAALHNFLAAIPKEFKLINLNLNDSNPVGSIDLFSVHIRNNFVLNLDNSYDKIFGLYHSKLKSSLKKARTSQLKISWNSPVFEVLPFINNQFKNGLPGIKPPDLVNLYLLLQKLLYKECAKIVHVVDPKGNCVAVAVFFLFKDRIIYLLSGSTPEGKKLQAMHYLLDRVIARYAGKAMYFDFEGSDIESIGRFFKRFGAQKVLYHSLYKNDLPTGLKQLYEIRKI